MDDIKWPTKEEWVAALRSGDYQQGMGRLRSWDMFCCLGVYADLCVENGIGEWDMIGEFRFDKILYCGGLPMRGESWLGVAQAMGQRPDKVSLSWLNDEGVPFNEIANIIEAEF